MPLSDQAKCLIETEEEILGQVLNTLKTERSRDVSRFRIETERARDLTSQRIATQRVEDKYQLVSDEAVSHTLSDLKKKDVSNIDTLLKKPYFARIVLEEQPAGGTARQIEYKLGFAANTECRIVDWRKAPIAKLYYEYKEGEEYAEEIQGTDRHGRVLLRHTLDVDGGVINRLVCGLGTFERKNGEWLQLSDGTPRPRRNPGELPEILSLITADQFKTITEDAQTAILIQGIAGSGKTTVALHRLAWLLHHENSPLKAHQAVAIVLSQALKNYVSKTLPQMGIQGVRVITFREFAAETIGAQLPHLQLPHSKESATTLKRPDEPSPRSIDRVKRSMALLQVLENYAKNYAQRTTWTGYERDLVSVLSQPQAILAADETGLLDAELIAQARSRSMQNIENSVCDPADDALLLRLIELKTGSLTLRGGTAGHYGHVVVDEVQDFSPVELAAVIGAVAELRNLTIVGDTSQKLDDSHVFPGWDKLRERWAFKDAMSKYVSLTVSHRSTLPIMRLADHIQERDVVTEGRPGRAPIWFRCRKESDCLEAARGWLNKALERYPGYLTAVLCADPQEAKYVLSLLTPTFGNTIRYGDEYSFSFAEGIVVAPVRVVKGLEFTNVVLWNPSAQHYPVTQESRNALYVAITRAEENLCLVTHSRPSEILPPFHSSLVRAVDMRQDEDEVPSSG